MREFRIKCGSHTSGYLSAKMLVPGIIINNITYAFQLRPMLDKELWFGVFVTIMSTIIFTSCNLTRI